MEVGDGVLAFSIAFGKWNSNLFSMVWRMNPETMVTIHPQWVMLMGSKLVGDCVKNNGLLLLSETTSSEPSDGSFGL